MLEESARQNKTAVLEKSTKMSTMDPSETEEMVFDEEMVEVSTEMTNGDETTESEVDKFAGVDLDALLEEDDEDDQEDLDTAAAADSNVSRDGKSPTDENTASKLIQLPLNRIKQIMKQDPDLDRVNPESVFAVAKATELFIQSLASEVCKYTMRAKKKTIQMRDVTACIEDVCCMQFLEGIFPAS